MKKIKTKSKERSRDLAIAILEIFEEKLDELNVSLPDKNRRGKITQARIFGDTYYDLEDEITSLIHLNKRVLKEIIT